MSDTLACRYKAKVKGKPFLLQVIKTQSGDGMLGYHPSFDIR